MRKRNIDCVFEECLSAHLEGRRSIEQSLDLYPDLASELEPLLRTAVEIHDNLTSWRPASFLEEQARQRFLAVARQRRRAPSARQPVWRWSNRALWATGAVAAGISLIGVTLAGMNLPDGGDSGPAIVRPINPTGGNSSATGIGGPLEDIAEKLGALRSAVEQGATVSQMTEAIKDVRSATVIIAHQLQGPDKISSSERDQLASTISEQYKVLTAIVEKQPIASGAEEVQATLTLTEEIFKRLQIPLTPPATVVPTATPTPAATRTSSPTVAPTDTPAPTETPSPTPLPTETPAGTPTPEPTATSAPSSPPTPQAIATPTSSPRASTSAASPPPTPRGR